MDSLCIVCLGNPGKNYDKTRHNMRFMIADALLSHWNINMLKHKFNASFASIKRFDKTIYIVKPLTYMNLSGQAVSDFSHYFKIQPHHVLIIYDDIDLDFGLLRYRSSGGAGTHNGVKSILNSLKSRDVPRLRVGIGPVNTTSDLKEFVLRPFSDKERVGLDRIISGCIQFIETFLGDGELAAMNQFNNKSFLA